VPAITPPDPHLTDGRIAVRPPADRDVPAITQACQDRKIVRYTTVPSPYTEDDARAFLAFSRAGFEDGTAAPMVIVAPATGALLGTCGIVDHDTRDLTAEIGYWVANHARGSGVASAATRLVCRWAFEALGVERIHLEAATENAGSNAVARAVGFRLEGTLRSAASVGDDGRRGGERMDVNVYGLLPGELT
jgi:RimJ/RimL family protein N-acetyltransferase